MSSIELFKYQIKSVEFARDTKRCLLRLDTGLGKTLVAIETVKNLKNYTRVLVICPAFLKHNWNEEIDKWCGRKNYYKQKVNWTLDSYTNLSNVAKIEKHVLAKYHIIICDEAHYMKNWESKRTVNIIKGLLVKVRRCLLLSATPYVRSAADLHPLFSICEPGKWKTIASFKERYCLKKPNYFQRWKKWDYYGSEPKTAKELKLGAKRFMISFKKSKVLKDLPPKIRTTLYTKVGADFHLDNMELEEYIDIDTGKIKGGLKEILSKEAVKLGIAKIPTFLEWFENLDSEQSIIIFCRHIAVADQIRLALGFIDGMPVPVITGKTKMAIRHDTVKHFQRKTFRVLIATIGSCGVGLNLTAASIAYFLEFPWSYMELKQCEDRLHRIGQHNPVNIYHSVAKKTVDEILLGVIRRKIEGEDLTIGTY